MSQVFKNPPLASYFIAAVGRVFGFGEVALHAAFLLPALALVGGTYQLARRFTSQAWWAGLVVLFSPAFLVCASSVMSDIMMTALLLWGLIWWLRGLDSNRSRDFIVAGILLALAFTAKYFALLILPVCVVHALLRRPPHPRWMGAIAIPLAALVLYELWTASLYGRGLFWDSVIYSRTARATLAGSPLENLVTGLAFCGGCALPLLFLGPQLSRRKTLAALVVVAACWLCIRLVFSNAPAPTRLTMGYGWTQAPVLIQGLPLLFAGALGVMVLAGSLRLDFSGPMTARRADVLLLTLWGATALIFGTLLNWTLNARSLLPLLPPLAVLLACHLDAAWKGKARRNARFALSLAPAAMVAMVVVHGDFAAAGALREAARTLSRETAPLAPRVWFIEPGGFAFYAQEAGASQLDFVSPRIGTTDLVIRGDDAGTRFQLPFERLALRGQFSPPLHALSSTMDVRAFAGFYSTLRGPLPFSFFPRPQSRIYGIYAPR